jgi:hypothetical protein
MIQDQVPGPGRDLPTILPVTASGSSPVVQLLGPALAAAGLRLRDLISSHDLIPALDDCHVPNLVLLDIAGDTVSACHLQAAFQGHTAWCSIPMVMVNDTTGGRPVGGIPLAKVQPEASFESIPEPGEMVGIIQAIFQGKEACYKLRRLERNRLQVRLSLAFELQHIDETMTSLSRAAREVSARLAQVTKQQQALRRAQSRMGNSSLPQFTEIEEWISHQAATVDSYREQIHAFESERRELFLRRHRATKTLEADLQELDRQIFILSAVLKAKSGSEMRMLLRKARAA